MKKVALNWKKLTQATKFGIGVVFALVGLATLVLLIFNVSYAGQVFPRIYFGKMSIAGLNQAELRTTVTQAAETIKSKPIMIVIKDQTIDIKPDEIGVDLDVAATVHDGLSIGRRSTIVASLVEQSKLLITPRNVNSYLSFDEEAFKKLLDDRFKSFESRPENAMLEFKDNALRVKSSKAGVTIDRAQALRKITLAFETLSVEKPIILSVSESDPELTSDLLKGQLSDIQQMITEPMTLTWQDKIFEYTTEDMINWVSIDPQLTGRAIVGTNKEAIAQATDRIAKKINRPAKDARLKFQDQKVEVFEPSSSGYQLDKEKTIEMIVNSLKGVSQRKLVLPVVEKPPSVTTARVNDLGLSDLIGKATTSFVGSPENRQHNIGNGVRILNGMLIPPDGEFSTLAALGQIDDVAGFLPELVIKENRTTPEFGGGLCQVSTTLFRAVLSSGLPITERHNHSWRISYYERGVGPGLDATVYSPAPDLKFKNDTPGWILIQGSVKGNEITFEFYGAKDGRRSVIEGPRLLSSTNPPASVYIDSPEVPQGQTKQVEKPHPGGSTIATYIVYNADGSERNRQVFRSSYKAVPARYLVGTGVVPTPEPNSGTAEPVQQSTQPEPPSPPTNQPSQPVSEPPQPTQSPAELPSSSQTTLSQ